MSESGLYLDFPNLCEAMQDDNAPSITVNNKPETEEQPQENDNELKEKLLGNDDKSEEQTNENEDESEEPPQKNGNESEEHPNDHDNESEEQSKKNDPIHEYDDESEEQTHESHNESEGQAPENDNEFAEQPHENDNDNDSEEQPHDNDEESVLTIKSVPIVNSLYVNKSKPSKRKAKTKLDKPENGQREENLVCCLPDCGFSTSSRQSMTSHVRTHVENNPFQNYAEVVGKESCSGFSHKNSPKKQWTPIGSAVPVPPPHYTDDPIHEADNDDFEQASENDDESELTIKSVPIINPFYIKKNKPSPSKQQAKLSPKNKPVFQCQFCAYTTSYSSHLTTHNRIHTGDNPYKCTLCPSQFKLRTDFVRHNRRHTGEKPYGCDLCSYRCAIKSNLTKHNANNHNTDLELVCGFPDCGFKTSSRRSMTSHVRTHVENNPFRCSECEHVSTSTLTLNIHKRIHSDIRPFQCKYCPYAAKQSGNVRLHVTRKHPDKEPHKPLNTSKTGINIHADSRTACPYGRLCILLGVTSHDLYFTHDEEGFSLDGVGCMPPDEADQGLVKIEPIDDFGMEEEQSVEEKSVEEQSVEEQRPRKKHKTS